MKPLRILFATAEMAPLVKVGGLGDVAGTLPGALAARGHDVRVLLPAYAPELLERASELARLPRGAGRLLERHGGGLACPVWLLATPGFLRRGGRPYVNRAGRPWADNAVQFGRLARTVADIAAGRMALDWRPDVVHCNDWHTALTPVWMRLEEQPAAAVFTIHNLGYMGRFPASVLARLRLPVALNHPEALEFHGDIAFIKGGLRYAEQITTVSPRHAEEIRTPEFGAGLDGLLRARGDRLSGILNGLDYDTWNPATDAHLVHHFDGDDSAGKALERGALLRELGLAEGREPLLAWVGRLTAQKGADVLVAALGELMQRTVRLVILGSGDRTTEQALQRAARHWPGRLAVRTGFDEALAHRIYAGADMLLMPSRSEPCGLAQLCAMRYGTLPLVRPVGGLADTVIDAAGDPVRGTGLHIRGNDAAALTVAVDRAVGWYADGAHWARLRGNAMRQRFDWETSARQYEEVYHAALRDRS